LFGSALLVSPVYENQARSRNVYLPAGVRWYDFYSGAVHEGGEVIAAAAPLARMPLFVKAGSIIPLGPAIEYTGQKPDAPITLYVYAGQDGSFDLYEDDGLSYGYERGAFTRIPIKYDDAHHTLSIDARAGSFPGMSVQRSFKVRWISGNVNNNVVDFDAEPDAVIKYSGQPVTINR
jgi:alpha-D-xyloside xylohydrolase